MATLDEYDDPFDALLDFEDMLSEYTGAPFVVLTDCCTHALELSMRLPEYKQCMLPTRTYLSVPMMLTKIGVHYTLVENDWEEAGQYMLTEGIYDSARLFHEDMYIPGSYQCLSFGHGKPLQIGTGGAILLDSEGDYHALKAMAYDGRYIHEYSPWADQKTFHLGFHYMMRPEFAVKGFNMLKIGEIGDPPPFNYPDLREIDIVV